MIYKYKTTVTIAAGSGSVNTNNIIGGLCREILISPATSTTTYKVNIVDEDNLTIKSYDFKKGLYIDTTEFIAYGIYTINITSSSANEVFTIRMMVTECS
jgi:hypothetical protein